MRTWKDNKGREWSIELTVDDVERLAAHDLAIDLLDAVDEERSAALDAKLANPVTCCRALWVLLQGRGLHPEIDAAEFGRSHAGDTIDAAGEALDDAIVDFFPKRLRSVLLAVRAKRREIEAKSMERLQSLLSRPEVEAIVRQEFDALESDLLRRLASRRESAANSFGA